MRMRRKGDKKVQKDKRKEKEGKGRKRKEMKEIRAVYEESRNNCQKPKCPVWVKIPVFPGMYMLKTSQL